jgi:DNA (cytosine-5)-methyltransferase 1
MSKALAVDYKEGVSVKSRLHETPEKFLEDDSKRLLLQSQGCLYQYLESKKLQDGLTASYPRVIGERDPNNPHHWRWGFNWEEKINGVWKGRSIGSIPCGAVPMIRAMQRQGSTREDIVAFIKRAKTKTPSKPKLSANAPIAVVLFAGGGGVEAGMVQTGIRPAIVVEFDPTKPQLSAAIASVHHQNFNEYGCKIIQLTVQQVAPEFIGFPQRPDYLHASPVCANFSQAHTAKAGIAFETPDDLSAAQAIAAAIRQLRPRVFTLENVPRYQHSQSFSIILNALESLGYRVNYSVVNMADYGLPQARKRLVLVACQDLALTLPPTSKQVGWYGAISHLIPTMPDSQLLTRQQQALSQFLATNEPAPLLIARVGGRRLTKYKPGHLPATPYCAPISPTTRAATATNSLTSGCPMVLSSLCLSRGLQFYKGFPIGMSSHHKLPHLAQSSATLFRPVLQLSYSHTYKHN